MGGSFESIFGQTTLPEAPYEWTVALSSALTVLSWYENLPKDEVPPRWIWWSGELLEQWFEDVTERRNKRTKGKRDDEDVPLMSNALAGNIKQVEEDGRAVPI